MTDAPTIDLNQLAEVVASAITRANDKAKTDAALDAAKAAYLEKAAAEAAAAEPEPSKLEKARARRAETRTAVNALIAERRDRRRGIA